LDEHAPADATVAAIPFARPDITDAEVAAVERVLRSGWITTGEECLALERELAEYLGMEHVVAVSSCTAAIEIAYASLGLPSGARVGVPTWTFASSALAPFHHGALPVLLDVDPETLNLSTDALAPALEDGLDAVVVVHFGGVPVAAKVLAACADAGVPVIEDAAHSLGARDHRGPTAGQGSVAACLSFYATKNLTCAEGGALVTDRADVADFARSFRQHGLSRDAWARYRPGEWAQYDLIGAGIKANLPDVLAALARAQLSRFPAMQSRRRALVGRYRERLEGTSALSPLPRRLDPDGADHLFVVALAEGLRRDEVTAALDAAGIGFSVHFQPLHRFGWFRANAAVGPAGVDVAESLADRVLSLPLSAAMTDADVDRVCDVVLAAVGP
jgi:dTDP-4-amino-4,6-dideoxygalactose transaminase